MIKNLNRQFSNEWVQMPPTYPEKQTIPLISKEMQIKIKINYHLIGVRMVNTKNMTTLVRI